MWQGSYRPRERIVWLDVGIHGPLGARWYNFVLDTGSPVTVVDPGVVDELGYGAAMGKAIRTFWSIGGSQAGYSLDVQCLEVMGLLLEQCEVVCQDLPRELGVDGLIGMDLLEGHVLTLDGVGGHLRRHHIDS